MNLLAISIYNFKGEKDYCH